MLKRITQKNNGTRNREINVKLCKNKVTSREQKQLITVVDQFGVKILTSGYSLSQTRRIALNGIRGWEKRKSLAMKERNKLFRTGKESRPQRIKKKTVGRTTWFKNKPSSKKDTT